jgi:hypothetical protein
MSANFDLHRLSNQLIINAFWNAARKLGVANEWSVLENAGLDLKQLAQEREAPYTGPGFAQMSGLNESERQALAAELRTLLGEEASSGPASDGLTLAAPPDQQIQLDTATTDLEARTLATIWNRYGGLLSRLADELQIDPALAVAVLKVESGSWAFLSESRRMVIRFENHIFYDCWGKQRPDLFNQHFRFDPTIRWKGHEWRPDPNSPWLPCHTNQLAEWQVFAFARTRCNDSAAKLATSMGPAQIMGFNFDRLGYDSVDAMYDAFESSEEHQLRGFFAFVRSQPGALAALQNNDLHTFARIYNGVGQEERYERLMREAHTSLLNLRGAQATVALPPAIPLELPAALPVEGAVLVGQAVPPLQLPAPTVESDLATSDPELYAAWRNHIKQGFEQNSQMFQQILSAFLGPYHSTVLMYRVLFGVGIAALVAAVGLSAWTRQPSFGLIFAGLSAAAFISYFLSRPLRSLEENLQFITWLGLIYNTYWTRLANISDRTNIQQELQDAMQDAVDQLEDLIDKSSGLSRQRPDLS